MIKLASSWSSWLEQIPARHHTKLKVKDEGGESSCVFLNYDTNRSVLNALHD